MGSPSLRVNVVWAVLGNGMAVFSTWVLLVFLTKMASVETVGVYGVAQAVNVPVCVLLGLKLQQIQVTDARDDYAFGHYFALKIVLAVLMIVVSAIIGFAFYASETALLTAALAVGGAAADVRENFLTVMQKSERMDRTMISRFLQGMLAIVLFAGLYWCTRSLCWAAVGLILSRVGVLLWYDAPTGRRLLLERAARDPAVSPGIAPRWQWQRLWRLAVLAAPLGLVGWFATLFTSVPRLVLDKVVGKEEVGYFVALSSLLLAGSFMTNAVGQTVAPRMAKYYDQDRAAFRLLLGKLVAMGLAAGGGGILISVLCGPLILRLFFTPAYAAHNDVFIQIMIAGAMLFLFSSVVTGLTAAQRYAVQLPVYALATTAALGAAYLLIPRYGMIGAAWSLTICYAVGLSGCAAALLLAMRANPLPQRAA